MILSIITPAVVAACALPQTHRLQVQEWKHQVPPPGQTRVLSDPPFYPIIAKTQLLVHLLYAKPQDLLFFLHPSFPDAGHLKYAGVVGDSFCHRFAKIGFWHQLSQLLGSLRNLLRSILLSIYFNLVIGLIFLLMERIVLSGCVACLFATCPTSLRLFLKETTEAVILFQDLEHYRLAPFHNCHNRVCSTKIYTDNLTHLSTILPINISCHLYIIIAYMLMPSKPYYAGADLSLVFISFLNSSRTILGSMSSDSQP